MTVHLFKETPFSQQAWQSNITMKTHKQILSSNFLAPFKTHLCLLALFLQCFPVLYMHFSLSSGPHSLHILTVLILIILIYYVKKFSQR